MNMHDNVMWLKPLWVSISTPNISAVCIMRNMLLLCKDNVRGTILLQALSGALCTMQLTARMSAKHEF
jgi:hypothetical protein